MNKWQIIQSALCSAWQVGWSVYRGLSAITDWEHFTSLDIEHRVGATHDIQ